MITPGKVYGGIEHYLESAYPLMVFMSIVLITVTLYLLYKRDPVILAVWLTYMFLP